MRVICAGGYSGPETESAGENNTYPQYSADMLPFIFSVRIFAIDSPSPVPPFAVFTVKKRSNRCAVLTVSSSPALFFKYHVPSDDRHTERSPSEYFAAFERILSNILRSAFPSSVRTTGRSGILISGTIPRPDKTP